MLVLRPLIFGALSFAVACGGGGGAAANDDSPDATTTDATTADASADAPTEDAGSDANACANDNDLGPACQPAQQVAVWTQMNQAPITLPNHAALLDLYPCDAGITLAGATYVLCAPTPLGVGDAGPFAWGGGVELQFDADSGLGDRLSLFAGYHGALTFESAGGHASYVVAIGAQVTKNGAPFSITGAATDGGLDGGLDAATSGPFDELYRALISTFARTIPLDPAGTTCESTQKCTVVALNDVIAFSVPALGVTVWFESIPLLTRIDLVPTAPR